MDARSGAGVAVSLERFGAAAQVLCQQRLGAGEKSSWFSRLKKWPSRA